MAREPIPTWYFALVIVRLGHRFLLVHETKHGERWYLPAGRVERFESMVDGAMRETLEEAGIRIAIDGIVRIEHSQQMDGSARVRVIFVAHPIDDTAPKSEPDEHSQQAAWVSLDELHEYPLRGDEVRTWFEYIARGGPVYPIALLTDEGAPIASR